MSQVLIIAYGNPLRSDDGVAWQAADALERISDSDKLEILRVHQLAPELAASISRSEAVIFLDAAAPSPDAKSGEILVEKIQPGDSTNSGAFCHAFSPESVLAMAQQLYGARPDAYFVSMIGETFAHGESLSPAVAARVPAMVERIQRLVEEIVSANRSFKP
jgi:hydrogenase maturation protease